METYRLTKLFDIDKFYVMRKEIPLARKPRKEIVTTLKAKLGKDKYDDINIFLDQLSDDIQRDAAKSSYPEIWKEYVRVAYKSKPFAEGTRQSNNNKIIDMMWEVLTHEDTADKILNPGGFEEQKYEGYLAQAARITGKSVTELESKSTSELKDICSTNKNLSFIGTHTQFYKQNAAAGSILAIFAVAKVAHACLESNGFQVDVNQVCGIKEPTNILGLTFSGRMILDPQKDVEGNFIGKTLGSLVASAADAVKDPVLNLMNINSDTVNILNTMIRMGIPFKSAARLLSSQVVTDLLERYNTAKLTESTSFNRVLEEMLTEIRDANNLEDSQLESEDLTLKEVNSAILERNTAVDYKILLTLQRMNQINTAMSSLNFATRFNSISSAVGPLIVDNLMIEHKLDNFAEGIYWQDFETGFDKVFELHPILDKFHDSVALARELFGNQFPTYSYQFGNILNTLNNTTLLDNLYRDRKVFSKFNDFYMSYLLMANGVISSDPEVAKYYITKFPAEFSSKGYKDKYTGNPLIDAIRFDVDADSKNPVIKINTTGLDDTTKSPLISGWLDLYKAGDEGKKLAADLFKYCFYKGGIGFNPKTFMNILPVQLRMRIKGYADTFKKLPEISAQDLINQFVRNNWNDNKVVPYRSFAKPLQIHMGGIVYMSGDEARQFQSTLAFKTKVGQNTVLFIRDGEFDKDAETITFKEAIPLGNNGEFLEVTPLYREKSIFKSPANPATKEEIGEQTEDVTPIEPVEEETTKRQITTDEITDMANAILTPQEQNYAKNLGSDYIQSVKNMIMDRAKSKGVTVTKEQVDKIAKMFC